jgi:WsaF, C-terminal domain/WsaF, N-terminal domain
MLTPLALVRKVRDHLRLLRHDPEKFAANLLQFTNPARFQQKLLDILTAAPLHIRFDPALADRPALNVLQPTLSPTDMTGGPNTVVNIAFWVAKRGVSVRLVTTRNEASTDLSWFWQHLATVTGDPARPATLSVVSAADPARPCPIGPRDMFVASHWTSAQQIKTHLRSMEVKRFFYLIQDFEPGFYAWSSNHALALETYGLDHIGIFNERLLYDYLVSQQAGRYADPAFARQSLVFEPAIDRTLFSPPREPRTSSKRRLLFYARPSNPRNLLGLGLKALRAATADTAFQQAEWEFLAIGSRGGLPAIPVRPGHVLRPVPWADYAGYARQLRASDILLCPMLSPHTSYPVLEMAASGGIAVTNTFVCKTRERLEAISANIIAVPPTEEGFTQGLIEAATRVNRGVDIHAPLDMPTDWRASLSAIAGQIARLFQEITGQF